MADPVTLSALALGASAGGGLASILSGGGATPPAPAAAPPPAPPIQQPQGTRGGSPGTSGNVNGTPSFIGSSSLPQQQGYGTKTLLGQ